MTSMKIIQFSRSLIPLDHLRPKLFNSFTHLTVDVQFQTSTLVCTVVQKYHEMS